MVICSLKSCILIYLSIFLAETLPKKQSDSYSTSTEIGEVLGNPSLSIPKSISSKHPSLFVSYKQNTRVCYSLSVPINSGDTLVKNYIKVTDYARTCALGILVLITQGSHMFPKTRSSMRSHIRSLV